MKDSFYDLSTKFWLPALLATVAAIGMLVGYRLDEEYIRPDQALVELDRNNFKPGKIEELIKYVDAKYVDDVDTDKLMENTMGFILNQLDPFSSYLTPDALKRYQEQISGRFNGLGLELHFVRDTLSIFYVYPSSPAADAGLKSGGRILNINGKSVSGNLLSDADIDDIIQDASNQISIEYIDRFRQKRTVNIEAGLFSINSISSSYMINDSVGYVRLKRFTTSAYKDFMMAMGYLSEEYGMKHLVIDLRSNPGGVLQESIKILQEFYRESGKLLLFTQGDNNPREEYVTHGKPFHKVEKIVVLINNGSASASEVVAGAIQDTDRGIIIGENSYGKGLVQEHYKLSNGGELRLTIARYYTPSGRLIQRAYTSADESNMYKDTSDFKTSNGRSVSAGGGITPDEIVYQSASALDVLDSLSLENTHEIILDELLSSFYENADYSVDDIIKNEDEIRQKLYKYLIVKNVGMSERIEANQDIIKDYLFANYVHMLGGSRYSEEVLTKNESIIQSSIESISSQFNSTSLL